MSEKYGEFVESLDADKVRALACQVGIVAWGTASVASLRAILRESPPARHIWQMVYGVTA